MYYCGLHCLLSAAAYLRLNQHQAENERIGNGIKNAIEEADISNSAFEAKEEKATSIRQKRSLSSAGTNYYCLIKTCITHQ